MLFRDEYRISLGANLCANYSKGDTRNTLEFEEIECLQALFRYANQSLECITNTGKSIISVT